MPGQTNLIFRAPSRTPSLKERIDACSIEVQQPQQTSPTTCNIYRLHQERKKGRQRPCRPSHGRRSSLQATVPGRTRSDPLIAACMPIACPAWRRVPRASQRLSGCGEERAKPLDTCGKDRAEQGGLPGGAVDFRRHWRMLGHFRGQREFVVQFCGVSESMSLRGQRALDLRLRGRSTSARWLQRVTATTTSRFSAWTGAWTGAPGNSRVMCAFVACHVWHRCRSSAYCNGACFF